MQNEIEVSDHRNKRPRWTRRMSVDWNEIAGNLPTHRGRCNMLFIQTFHVKLLLKFRCTCIPYLLHSTRHRVKNRGYLVGTGWRLENCWEECLEHWLWDHKEPDISWKPVIRTEHCLGIVNLQDLQPTWKQQQANNKSNMLIKDRSAHPSVWIKTEYNVTTLNSYCHNDRNVTDAPLNLFSNNIKRTLPRAHC